MFNKDKDNGKLYFFFLIFLFFFIYYIFQPIFGHYQIWNRYIIQAALALVFSGLMYGVFFFMLLEVFFMFIHDKEENNKYFIKNEERDILNVIKEVYYNMEDFYCKTWCYQLLKINKEVCFLNPTINFLLYYTMPFLAYSILIFEMIYTFYILCLFIFFIIVCYWVGLISAISLITVLIG